MLDQGLWHRDVQLAVPQADSGVDLTSALDWYVVKTACLTTLDGAARDARCIAAVQHAADRPPTLSHRVSTQDLARLVDHAHHGDPVAIRAILQVIEPVVTRYCRARLGGRKLPNIAADDLAKAISVTVLAALPQYRGQGGEFLRFVHGIAARKVSAANRLVSRTRPVAIANHATAPAPPESPHADDVLGEQLFNLLPLLPGIHREVVALRLAAGLSAAETAEALGISVGAVLVTQHQALNRLRRLRHDADDSEAPRRPQSSQPARHLPPAGERPGRHAERCRC